MAPIDPVVQLSLNAFEDLDHYLGLGRKLGALRDHGVLVIGSGDIVHNLRAVDHGRPDTGYDWATRFDEVARETLGTAPTEVASLEGHPDFGRAVPTTAGAGAPLPDGFPVRDSNV